MSDLGGWPVAGCHLQTYSCRTRMSPIKVKVAVQHDGVECELEIRGGALFVTIGSGFILVIIWLAIRIFQGMHGVSSNLETSG